MREDLQGREFGQSAGSWGASSPYHTWRVYVMEDDAIVEKAFAWLYRIY
jgi:hypothetical protein